MKRALVFALAISIAHAPAAMAGESLMEAAVRVADRLVAADRPAMPETPATRVAAPNQPSKPAAKAYQGQPGAPAGVMSGRSKLLIGLGIAAALAGTMLAIDSRVEDNTPSTKGERTTKPF